MNSETLKTTIPRSQQGTLRHGHRTYGHSANGVPLRVYGPESGPVEVLIIASMHGDECDTTVVLSEALRSVPAVAVRNPVVLCCNPDGVLNGTRCNARGVDLNRNLPTANWSGETLLYRGHGQAKREIELSPGTGPASEPETRALLELVTRLQPRTVVSLHAPLACIEDPRGRPLAQWVAAEVGLPMIPDVGYDTPGSFGTWCAEQGIDIITWELPGDGIPDLIASHVPVLRRLVTGDYPGGPV